MRRTSHILRDDNRYLVVVGWDYDLETFYAHVHDRADGGDETDPLLRLGAEPREVPTISSLITLVSRFAPLTPATISTLRHEATPLGPQIDPLPEAS